MQHSKVPFRSVLVRNATDTSSWSERRRACTQEGRPVKTIQNHCYWSAFLCRIFNRKHCFLNAACRSTISTNRGRCRDVLGSIQIIQFPKNLLHSIRPPSWSLQAHLHCTLRITDCGVCSHTPSLTAVGILCCEYPGLPRVSRSASPQSAMS